MALTATLSNIRSFAAGDRKLCYATITVVADSTTAYTNSSPNFGISITGNASTTITTVGQLGTMLGAPHKLEHCVVLGPITTTGDAAAVGYHGRVDIAGVTGSSPKLRLFAAVSGQTTTEHSASDVADGTYTGTIFAIGY